MQSHRRQPTRLPRPWDSPGKNTGVDCHFLPQCMKVKSESEVAQSCPTLSDPMDCSPPGSSIHGIFQARVLEWGAIAFSRNLPSTPQLWHLVDQWSLNYYHRNTWAFIQMQILVPSQGREPESLYVQQVPRWYWYCWSSDQTSKSSISFRVKSIFFHLRLFSCFSLLSSKFGKQ